MSSSAFLACSSLSSRCDPPLSSLPLLRGPVRSSFFGECPRVRGSDCSSTLAQLHHERNTRHSTIGTSLAHPIDILSNMALRPSRPLHTGASCKTWPFTVREPPSILADIPHTLDHQERRSSLRIQTPYLLRNLRDRRIRSSRGIAACLSCALGLNFPSSPTDANLRSRVQQICRQMHAAQLKVRVLYE